MSRSKWKGPFVKDINLNSLKDNNGNVKNIFFEYASRDTEIVPCFVGLTLNVHNGKSFKEIVVNESMVGQKFGSFSFTRAQYIFKKKKKKNRGSKK